MDKCYCFSCASKRPSEWMPTWTQADDRMIVCEFCGNKRCPHATDHDLACTNSNEPGQPGSRYSAPTPSPK